jgi:DNA repair protein RecO (recombination protein O)
MVNIIKTKGIVLNTQPFKESSLIASILTNKFGKIKVLAKGVRRPKSKICGALERFNLDEIIFYKKELKEMYNLSDAEIIQGYEKIRCSPERVNAAMVLCEFFYKTLPAEEYDEHSFGLLFSFLEELENAKESTIRSLTFRYLTKVLVGAGVRPHLESCVRCHQKIKWGDKKFDFSISAGGLVCDKHFDDTVIFLNNKTINALRQIYNNENIEIDENSLGELEKFFPDYLYYHLNNLKLNSLKYLK